MPADPGALLLLSVRYAALCGALVLASWVLLRLHRRRLAALGFGLHRRWALEVGQGALVGFGVGRWLSLSPLGGLLGAIPVVGFIEESLKYFAVRYSVYALPEFDERIDGVIYGTTAGLGYATALNLHYIVTTGGVNLQAAVIRIVVTALAQASFAGLTGYFLGRAKFEDEPVWWLPAGVTLAAILNGVFTTLHGELSTPALHLAGGGFNPWPGLALAAVIAGGTLGLLYYLMRRANRLTLSGADSQGGEV